MKNVIEVEELTKIYHDNLVAVDDISFSVGEGEIFGFLGPNGAGKSTTIKCVIGLLRPTQGRIRVHGVDAIHHPGTVKRYIGYAAQETAIDDRLTGWENLYLQGRFFHLSREEVLTRGREILELFGLWERRGDLTETYSGGMLKRLDIAIALIHRPRILFLDEPTLGLDVQTRAVIWDYIQKLRTEHEMTIFLTTHYMEEADALCDRVAIIDHGKIAALDRPGALKAQIGGDVITVRFLDSGPATLSLVETIRSLPEIVEVSQGEDGITRIVVRQHGDRVIPELFSLAIHHGVRIDSLRLKRPSLDDVYLHFTGRDIREEGGSREELHRARRAQRRLRR
ncbi:MAG: ATP-binding cassette domain-containing protein [Candidatus Bipolaricaulis sp.]|nr:ATP-binding cassette domain-containing protein [Candidatus Bipolaricaulis sp.]MDY0392551.1 ATP-binding cassette domain-containing protein [Candidatus Bipolaricaulis sp.]